MTLQDIRFLIGMARRNHWRTWPAIWRTSRPAASERRRKTMELIVSMHREGKDAGKVRKVDGKVIEIRGPDRAA